MCEVSMTGFSERENVASLYNLHSLSICSDISTLLDLSGAFCSKKEKEKEKEKRRRDLIDSSSMQELGKMMHATYH